MSLEFEKTNTPSSGRNTQVKLFYRDETGNQINVGEFESVTWRVQPEFADYRPMNTDKKIKVWTGTTISGTLNRGLVDFGIMNAIGTTTSLGECSMPEAFFMTVYYCIPNGVGTGTTKIIKLKGITFNSYEVAAAGANPTTEALDFEANEIII